MLTELFGNFVCQKRIDPTLDTLADYNQPNVNTGDGKGRERARIIKREYFIFDPCLKSTKQPNS